jgi:hypothetical protein
MFRQAIAHIAPFLVNESLICLPGLEQLNFEMGIRPPAFEI